MKVTFIKTGKRVKPKENIFNTYFNKNIDKNKKINKTPNETVKIKNDNKNNEHKKINKSEIGGAFKTIFKKNQIVILTLALMLITAGYMNYNNLGEENISLAEIGDAKLVSTNIVENVDEKNTNILETSENKDNIVEIDEDIDNNQDNTIETNENIVSNQDNTIEINNNVSKNYFVQTRLERETMYSQMIETYQKIIENESIPADQRAIATNEIKNINDRKNAISIIENLIKTKGFEDVVLLINDNNINVIVKQDNNLSEEQVAQISNIVARELNAKIEDIHITVKK